ncbi:MAG: S8 family serine peptidase [Christiangramia sp.]|nr:S8 family serine peptidase [Christiangramia sp.]
MKRLLFLFLFISCLSYSQQEHAWVYFKDKLNVEASLADPSLILSEEAIQRKALHNTPIDERDVPVNEAYISSLKDQEGIQVMAKSKWLNCAHVIGELSAIDNLISLEFVEKIEFANRNLQDRSLNEEEKMVSKLDSHIDYDYGYSENQVTMLGTDFLHENDLTGKAMVIAVLDAGFPNIENLVAFERLRSEGRLLGGYDFHDRSDFYTNPNLSNHGTLVLSTMAAFLDEQLIGTAPGASFYLFRTEVSVSETPVEESYWVEAAERADSLGVDIINSSLSYAIFDNPAYNYSMEDMDGETSFVSRGANIATEKGLLVVVSAGNSGESETFPRVGAPADANVLTVGAVDKDRNYVAFSSIGPTADGRIKPDVMAQGLAVVAADQANNLVSVSGTSFSSPIIAGSIASLWQKDPSLTNLEIMQLVRESSSLFNNPNFRFGYGIPDFEKAFSSIIIENNDLEFAYSPNPVTDVLKFRRTGPENYNVKLFDLQGQKILEKDNVQNEIDLSGFSRGIYIAMFEQNNFRKSFLIIKK